MKFKSLAIAAVSLLAVASTVAAAPVDLSSCTEITVRDSRSSGRFIWKQVGNHFPGNGVIVAPRYYYPIPPKVEILDQATDELIDTAKLKSDGICAGNRECLFAATFLTKRNGAFYNRRYETGIKVKISPRAPQNGRVCTYYTIARPDRRAEFRNPAQIF